MDKILVNVLVISLSTLPSLICGRKDKSSPSIIIISPQNNDYGGPLPPPEMMGPPPLMGQMDHMGDLGHMGSMGGMGSMGPMGGPAMDVMSRLPPPYSLTRFSHDGDLAMAGSSPELMSMGHMGTMPMMSMPSPMMPNFVLVPIRVPSGPYGHVRSLRRQNQPKGIADILSADDDRKEQSSGSRDRERERERQRDRDRWSRDQEPTRRHGALTSVAPPTMPMTPMNWSTEQQAALESLPADLWN
ncbi:hypothetical protein HDE_12300 [Halotydeus destructor]|nr:hypothetical protein HDE_12300 [Halotydeus destructor]